MIRSILCVGVVVLAGVLAGCGDEAKPTAEQKAPEYGQKSADQMKNEIGVPTSKGMQPAKPAREMSRVGRPPRASEGRSLRRVGIGFACLIAAVSALAWGGYQAVSGWRHQAGLERAREAVAEGRFAEARRWLARASARAPDDAETAYLLGVCEQAEGHADAALAAWGKVVPPSPFATPAALARGKLLVERGRFADAETVLAASARGAGSEAAEARYLLAQLDFWEGRADDQRRLLRDAWGRSPDRAGDLRDLWFTDSAAVLAEQVRAAVERAARLAPDDDRVWLAQAHLATLAGKFDAAAERLDACLHRGPEDPVVWRARLRWAVAAERTAEARRALVYLPTERFAPAEAPIPPRWFCRPPAG